MDRIVSWSHGLNGSRFSLSSYLKKEGIRLTSRMGQNFLLDRNILIKLVRSAGILSGDCILEIGGGLGHLTQEIIQSPAEQIFVFETDCKLYEILKIRFQDHKRVRIRKDFLDWNPQEEEFFLRKKKSSLKILGNVPYHYSSMILQHLVLKRKFFYSTVLTLQKELVRRIFFFSWNKRLLLDFCFLSEFLSTRKALSDFKASLFPET